MEALAEDELAENFRTGGKAQLLAALVAQPGLFAS